MNGNGAATARRATRVFTVLLLVALTTAAAPARAKDTAHTVIFQGLEGNEPLAEWLRDASGLARDKGHEGEGGGALHARVEEELPVLLKALRAKGYYDATLRAEIDADAEPVTVVYIVAPGEPYHVSSSRIEAADPAVRLPDIAFAPGAPADAAALLETADAIRTAIGKDQCFLSIEVEAALELDPATHTAAALFTVTTGPKADFGALTVTGADTVDESHIRRQIPWQQGECFALSAVESVRTTLLKSQLFATADVDYGDTPDAGGQVPVTITVTERFHRTVKAGVSYMTDEGPGVSAGWEHRNFFGGAEKLDLRGVISTLEYSAETNYTEPFFLRNDQTLKLGARLAEERPDAYTSRNLNLTSMVERKLTGRITAGAGAGYRLSRVEDVNGTETYGLISFPVYGQYDSRDDVLDPRRGFVTKAETAPYVDTLGNDAMFLRTLVTGSAYFALPGPYDPVLAVRGALGSITAESTATIPADLRFYAGGGSSVRGYGYQELSPYAAGEPLGGRSLLETSAELRVKFTDTIGTAVFIDGGNAYDSQYPDFDGGIRFGAGAGLRYYTGFGPLRLDVAVPLDRRPQDSAYQLYVSLGQAF